MLEALKPQLLRQGPLGIFAVLVWWELHALRVELPHQVAVEVALMLVEHERSCPTPPSPAPAVPLRGTL